MSPELDLVADLTAKDDDGLGWSLLTEARDPDRVRPGAMLVAGHPQAMAVVRIVSVNEHGEVRFSVLPGSVEKNRHLLGRTAADHQVVFDGAADPLHEPCAAPVQWTTTNIAEAFPVVPTPLTWTIWSPLIEQATRDCYYAVGALRESERTIPRRYDRRVLRIAYGQPVLNLDVLGEFAGRMPGTAPAVLSTSREAEEALTGEGEWATTSTAVGKRSLQVCLRMPVAAIRSRRRLIRLSGKSAKWWTSTVRAAEPTSQDPYAILDEGAALMAAIFVPHSVCGMVASAVYGLVSKTCADANQPGLEQVLLTSGATEESRTVDDLWKLAQGDLTLQAFLDVHGYHGPAEGELSSQPWREDARPVSRLAEQYRSLDEAASPSGIRSKREHRRDVANTRLRQVLSRSARYRLNVLVWLGNRYVPMRELGRGAFLRAADGVRFAARRIGDDLHVAGVLEDPEDVFFLTRDELRSAYTTDALRSRIAHRRKIRERYLRLRLPEYWVGEAPPDGAGERAASPDATVDVQGLGVSPGVVEGLARVVSDPSDPGVLEPGEILVCHTTDPSWASFFVVAAGVVIDVGGVLSHGAIVARELAIPCVINAQNATTSIRTGDRLRIDGTSGAVQVLGPSPG